MNSGRRTAACGAVVSGNIFQGDSRDLERLRYPVGRFEMKGGVTEGELALAIREIAETPARLRRAVETLAGEQLDTPYRPGGWTTRQVVHHLADAHINAYTRLRLTLTEDEPAIKTYEQWRWAELADVRTLPPETSLALLDALHARWVALLRALSPDEFARAFRHPDWGRMTLARQTALCAWHGRHHTAHVALISSRAERSGG